MSKELDLTAIESAILFVPTGECKWQFGTQEYFLSEEGALCYFNQPTTWEYAKNDPRPIYKRADIQPLIAEIKRLRTQLTTAKAEGAVDALERASEAILDASHPDWKDHEISTWLNDRAAEISAAEIRKATNATT